MIVVRVEAGRWQCREKPTHGRLWGPSQRILKGSLPSLARTINDQVAELGEAETAQRLAESCRDRLY